MEVKADLGHVCRWKVFHSLGPVVQSIVSLTSMLMTNWLTIVANDVTLANNFKFWTIGPWSYN